MLEAEKRPWGFKDGIWQDFKNDFLAPLGRCAYCEGRYFAGEFDDAEHGSPPAEPYSSILITIRADGARSGPKRAVNSYSKLLPGQLTLFGRPGFLFRFTTGLRCSRPFIFQNSFCLLDFACKCIFLARARGRVPTPAHSPDEFGKGRDVH